MKKEARLMVAAFCCMVLVAAVSAIPLASTNVAIHPPAISAQAAMQTQAATGTISAVDKASFTITLPPSHDRNVSVSQAQQDPPKSMTFVVDKNTTIEGKLRVGADAEVTYRDDGGNHLAIAVRVTPPQM
jgi:Cu/Ag efflux protein CusF